MSRIAKLTHLPSIRYPDSLGYLYLYLTQQIKNSFQFQISEAEIKEIEEYHISGKSRADSGIYSFIPRLDIILFLYAHIHINIHIN